MQVPPSPMYLSGGSCPSRLPGEIQATRLQSVRVTKLRPTDVPSSQSLLPSSPPPPPRRLFHSLGAGKGARQAPTPSRAPSPFPAFLAPALAPEPIFKTNFAQLFRGLCSPSLGSPSSRPPAAPARLSPTRAARLASWAAPAPLSPPGGIRRHPSTHRSLGVPSAESQGEQQEEATGARAQLHSPPPPGAPQPRRS